MARCLRADFLSLTGGYCVCQTHIVMNSDEYGDRGIADRQFHLSLGLGLSFNLGYVFCTGICCVLSLCVLLEVVDEHKNKPKDRIVFGHCATLLLCSLMRSSDTFHVQCSTLARCCQVFLMKFFWIFWRVSSCLLIHEKHQASKKMVISGIIVVGKCRNTYKSGKCKCIGSGQGKVVGLMYLQIRVL